MGAFDFLRTDRNFAGHWDPSDSTIDWCEINYVYTFYIAEMVNTMTNIPQIACNISLAKKTYNSGVPSRYALVYISSMIIGIGSFGFHGTLRWTWQLLDEFPMIYHATLMVYLLLDNLPGWEPRWGVAGPLVAFGWLVVATTSYLVSKNPILHEVTFAVFMLIVVGYSTYLAAQFPERKAKLLKTLWQGTGIFAFAFLVWNIDNQLCHLWRDLRDSLSDKGLGFLSPLTEGHGWWHLLTTLGAIQMHASIITIILSVKTDPSLWDYDETAWLPYVRRVKPDKSE